MTPPDGLLLELPRQTCKQIAGSGLSGAKIRIIFQPQCNKTTENGIICTFYRYFYTYICTKSGKRRKKMSRAKL